MTGPNITDTYLPIVAGVIDAIAAADRDPQAVVLYIETLTPDEATIATAAAISIAAGAISQLTTETGIPRDVWIRRARTRAAA